METKQEHNSASSGNAMIYVLIVIALFAALAFILSRQGQNGEHSAMGAQQIEIESTQMLQASMQIKQAIDSMMFGGTTIDALDFMPPSDAAFDTPPRTVKVFHPDGGGVIMPHLPDGAAGSASDPAAGWYLGRFNTVEWTESTATDVILTAYDIPKALCAKINEKLTGSATIPVSSAPLRDVLVDDAAHSGSNVALTATNCPGCEGKASLCVEGPTNDIWAFYSILEQR